VTGSDSRRGQCETSEALVKVSRRVQEETAWDSPEARMIFPSIEDDTTVSLSTREQG
jgi:hypothetical protein